MTGIRISAIVAFSCALGLAPLAVAADPGDECCSQPGRIESAKKLLAQSENFKLKASQYHLNAKESIKDAKFLTGKADSLKARAGAVDSNSPKELQSSISAFKEHAAQYKAHLDKVERELGHCHSSESEYQAHLQEYTLHTQQYHLADIKPPHICGRLQMSERDASHVANTLRSDQQRLVKSEVDLASAENNLQTSMQNSMQTDAALYHRSQLAEEERKLSGEFAGLKTEYELMQMQRDALLGHAASMGSKSVQGKLK